MGKRWQRLFSMSPDEVWLRSRQLFAARADALRYRMGNSFAVGIRPTGAPSPSFYFRDDEVGRICDLLKRRLPEKAEEILSRAERICEHRFDLLGYEALDYGREIDWHCDRVHGKRAPHRPFYQLDFLDFGECGDVKITWELNRHQHFVVLAKAYRLSGKEKFAQEIFRQWEHWHAHNPYPIGINWASSLEIAFRSLSWMWMYFLLRESPGFPGKFREKWLQALGISGRHLERHLSTYFSPNTHLLGEGVALFCIGVLSPELRPAGRWKRLGWNIVLQEAERQVRADGVHFEQAVYYHVYALDLFLHARILASLNGVEVPAGLDVVLQKMAQALCLAGRAGPPARLGDDDGGRVFDGQRNRPEFLLDPLATCAILFGRGDFAALVSQLPEETLWLLGPEGAARFDALASPLPSASSTALEAAGVYLIAAEDPPSQMTIDAGPQGTKNAGHGHADALSVCLNSGGEPVLVDPGTFEYVGSGAARDRFRETAAHNTLTVDGLSQAGPDGPFGWKSLPVTRREMWINGRSFDLFRGSHNGYARLAPPVLHRRWIFARKGRFWLIRDVVEGTGEHRLDLYWHLAPAMSRKGDNALLFGAANRGPELSVLTVAGHGWEEQVETGFYSSAYGRMQPAPVIHFQTTRQTPQEFVSLFVPKLIAATSQLVKMQGSDVRTVSGYRYRTEVEEHLVIFAGSQPWSLGAWSSDCEFVYFGEQRNQERCLVIGNGSYVAIDGRPLVSFRQPVTYCEITDVDGQTELSGSDLGLLASHLPLNSITGEAHPVLAEKGHPSMEGTRR